MDFTQTWILCQLWRVVSCCQSKGVRLHQADLPWVYGIVERYNVPMEKLEKASTLNELGSLLFPQHYWRQTPVEVPRPENVEVLLAA